MAARVLTFVILLGLLAACSTGIENSRTPDPSVEPRVRVIVELSDPTSAEAVLEFVGDRATKVRRAPSGTYLFLELPESLIGELRTRPGVAKVSLDVADGTGG